MSPFDTEPRMTASPSIEKAARQKRLLDMWDKERNESPFPDVAPDSKAVRAFVCPSCGRPFRSTAYGAAGLGRCIACFERENPDRVRRAAEGFSEDLRDVFYSQLDGGAPSKHTITLADVDENGEVVLGDGPLVHDVDFLPGEAGYANRASFKTAGFATVVAACARWAAGLHGGGPVDDAARELAAQERCELDGARARVSTVLAEVELAVTGQACRLWACEVETKPGGKKGRGRSSHAFLNVAEDSEETVVVAAETTTGGRGKRTPPVLAELFAALSDELGFEVAGVPASTRPRAFSRKTVGELAGSLCSASRELPLVMVCDDGKGAWPVDPSDVARDVAGLAEVWSFQTSDPDVASAVEAFFGGPGQTPMSFLAPTPGRIDVYDIGRELFDPEAESVRGVTGDKWPAARSEVYSLAESAVGTMLLYSPAHVAAYLDRVEEAREAERAEAEARAVEQAEARLAKQRAEQDAAMTPLERARALSRAAEELSALLERDEEARADAEELSRTKAGLAALEADLSEANSALEAERALRSQAEAAAEAAKQAEADAVQLAEEAERDRNAAVSKAAHADELSKLVDALKQENARLAEHESALRDLERLPSTEAEALELAAKAFSDRVTVLPAALDSARDHDGSADETWRIVRAIATVLWPLRFERDEVGERLDVAFREKTGFEFSTGERDLTKSMKAERTRLYKGRKVVFGDHVKGTSGPRSKPLRVHVLFDDEDRTIAIGHCGAHLTNNATRHCK